MFLLSRDESGLSVILSYCRGTITAVDARDLLARIETRMDTFATTADLH